MPRDRSTLGAPLGVDGPWLAAILDALDEIACLLRVRLPGGDPVEPNDLAQPWMTERIQAEASQPEQDRPAESKPEPVKVQEPAPDNAPTVEATPATETADDDANADSPPPPPNRQGRGSSAEAWTAWAEQAGVAVPDGATRNDIIAACIRAGVLSEE